MKVGWLKDWVNEGSGGCEVHEDKRIGIVSGRHKWRITKEVRRVKKQECEKQSECSC